MILPALLCTSRTYAHNGTVERVRAALGATVAIFDGVQPHVPVSSVGAALDLAVPAYTSAPTARHAR